MAAIDGAEMGRLDAQTLAHLLGAAFGLFIPPAIRKMMGRNDPLGRAEEALVCMRNTRPRTFKEVVAAQDPTEMARLERGDHFVDPSVNAFHGEVSVNEDRFGTGEWRVEYFDDDGGCYVTIFAGPAAERRSRGYFNSLKAGRLSIKREPLPQ